MSSTKKSNTPRPPLPVLSVESFITLHYIAVSRHLYPNHPTIGCKLSYSVPAETSSFCFVYLSCMNKGEVTRDLALYSEVTWA